MTESTRAAIFETLTSWSRLITAATIITGAVSFILSTATVIVFKVWGATLLSMAGVATSTEMREMQATVNDLLQAVTVLARPERVAYYRDLPRIVTPTCAPGEECAAAIYVERDTKAVECRVIPGATQVLVTQDNVTYALPVISPRQVVNVGASSRGLELGFELPTALRPGEARAVIETQYTNCLWQTNGQPPVIEASPEFVINIS